MPATPYHDSEVVDVPWDGPAAEAALPNDAGRALYERMFAWRDPDGDPDTKAAYRFPHHEVQEEEPAAANVGACRAVLSRLPQSNVPEEDHDAIRSHVQRHIDRFNEEQEGEDGEEARASRRDLGAALLAILASRTWALDRRVLAALLSLDPALYASEARPRALAMVSERGSQVGDIAVIPLQGLLMPEVGLFALFFGGGGLRDFRRELERAVASPDIAAIVLDIDSPGGLVDHIPETAAELRAARAQKPLVAVANTQAASAAYWLASQADEVSVTPSGEAGSIGVYSEHRDISGALASAGIVPTLVSAGRYKVEGNPYEPLAGEARDQWQADVDHFYELFVADVARGRGVDASEVRQGFGEGRSLHADAARRAGLADRVETLDAAIRRLTSPAGRAALERRRAIGHTPEAMHICTRQLHEADRERLVKVLTAR